MAEYVSLNENPAANFTHIQTRSVGKAHTSGVTGRYTYTLTVNEKLIYTISVKAFL